MNKNSLRLLLSVGLILLIVVSWYTLINDKAKADAKYESYLTVARQKAKAELYEDAMDYYNAALTERDSVELRDEAAGIYKKYASVFDYELYCEDITTAYPLEPVGYERLANYYKETKAYDSCFSVIEMVHKRKIKSKVIENIEKELEFLYTLDAKSVIELDDYSAGYCPALIKENQWLFLNSNGSRASSVFLKISHFMSDGIALVQLSNERFVFVATNGRYKGYAPDDLKIEDFKTFSMGKIAIKVDGKYSFYDAYYKKLFGSYDEAGTFFEGFAPVKKGEKWAIIDESGKEVTKYDFDEIVTDSRGIAFRDGVGFAKKGGKYILIDTSGKQVGKDTFDAVDTFNAELIAAVKKGEKWGYINSKGKKVVDYKYSNAKSFANKMAAVEIDGKWGYISSEDFKVKIEPAFEEAKDFLSNGRAFVKQENSWKVLRVYRLS